MSDTRGSLIPVQGPGFTGHICGETIDPPFEYGTGNWWILITENQFALFDSDPDTDEARARVDLRERAGSDRMDVPPDLCQGCGRVRPNWVTDPQTRSRVAKADICPQCFIEEAEEAGVHPHEWVLYAQTDLEEQ